jgi:hypothetical protein
VGLARGANRFSRPGYFLEGGIGSPGTSRGPSKPCWCRWSMAPTASGEPVRTSASDVLRRRVSYPQALSYRLRFGPPEKPRIVPKITVPDAPSQ